MNRQDFLKIAFGLIAIPLLSTDVEAQAKPVTQASLVKSLLTLADKAEKAGLQSDAKVILQAAAKILNVPIK